MKWVLIYVMFSVKSGATSVVQEFDDLESCNFALRVMNDSIVGHLKDQMTYITAAAGRCVPKSEPR
jgi:hypothetical protein